MTEDRERNMDMHAMNLRGEKCRLRAEGTFFTRPWKMQGGLPDDPVTAVTVTILLATRLAT